jgi:hypothetical protein
MSLLRRAVFMAAKRAAADPEIRARARRFAEDDIVPHVRDAAERVRPAVDGLRERTLETVGTLRETARDYPPADDPKAFLDAAGRRLRRTG